MVIVFERKIFQARDGFARHAADADEVNDKDGEEERDAHDAECALPFFDEDAVEHGGLFGGGFRRPGGRDLFRLAELLEIRNERDDFPVGRDFGAGGLEVGGDGPGLVSQTCWISASLVGG